MNVYCSVCGSEMEIMTDLVSELRVYPCGCGSNVKQKRQPKKYASDVASAASAEPLSSLESVPAVESDTQPRGLKINLWLIFLGCLIMQVALSLFGIKTPKESFDALFWQGCAFFAVWITQRPPDRG